MTTKKLLIVAVILISGVFTMATPAQNRGPSTPEERKRAVEVATLLENDPLNKDAESLGKKLMSWLIEVPDVPVKLCLNVLGDYSKLKGDYAPIMISQLTFSGAKFVIEHPDQAGDDYKMYLAGVEGALKAYQNIKKAKPKVRMEPLEQLLIKQQADQLGAFVKEAMSGCKAAP